MEHPIHFQSNDLRLVGVLSVPSDVQPGWQRPALIVLHGFGSNKNAENVLGPCHELAGLGYIILRFDMQGCGESEGQRGNLICLDQVQNTRDAFTFLNEQTQVQRGRIGVIGSSFGAAVAVYAAAVDERFTLAISSGGWGHGERKFHGQHKTLEAWDKFIAMLATGKRHREETGHFMLAEGNTRVWHVVADWLRLYLPLERV